MSGDIVVGIDLGTTNTCVSYFINNELKIIENKEGKYLTPSFVFFDDKYNAIVGETAQYLAASKPKNGIYEIKRFIGRRFDEVNLEQDLANLSFTVKELAGQPYVYLQQFNSYQNPEQISSQILMKIKKDVSERLGKDITQAVITVPAHFNVLQRKATLLAAKDAKIKVLKLLSEPTAAALTYFFEVQEEMEKYFLVYDLGGGTFDVAVLEKQGDNVNIIGVDGDSHLGGQDFDNIILNYVCQELKTICTVDALADKAIMRKLRNASCTAKEVLSLMTKTSMILEGVVENNEKAVEVPISRTKFEEMAQHLFHKTVDVVSRCIQNCKLTKNDIGRVVLVGGSTRIPGIQKALKTYFERDAFSKKLHPEECVAKGAALQAAMLSTNPKQKLKHLKINEVTSSSLGIEDVAHKMEVIIKKNTPVPTSKKITYVTRVDQQEAMCLKIFGGEKLDARKNTYLGMLKISDLTPAPPGKCTVIVNVSIDENGILTLIAKEKNTVNIRDLELVLVRENQSCICDSEEDDVRFAEFAEIKEYFLMYCIAVQYNFETSTKGQARQHVYARCQEIQNEIIKLDVKDIATLTHLGLTLKKMCSSVVKKYNFKNMPKSSAFIERIFKKL